VLRLSEKMDALYEPGLRLEAATVTRFCNPFAEPFLTIRSIDYRLYGTWVDTMKELQMKYVYKEYPGLTHGPSWRAPCRTFTHSSPSTPDPPPANRCREGVPLRTPSREFQSRH
jgi:hypothetical protein